VNRLGIGKKHLGREVIRDLRFGVGSFFCFTPLDPICYSWRGQGLALKERGPLKTTKR
jgi:hypothetical protein